MCGIAGTLGGRFVDTCAIHAMLDAMRYRGPDGKYLYSSSFYQGGMIRLAINDLSGGTQPFFSEDKKIVAFYNGEIYNSGEIKKRLSSTHHFVSDCDGEVISHLYEEVGEEVFSYLDGMYAIAIWDITKEMLFLARDIAGEKPLYYSINPDGRITYSSEVKSLIASRLIDTTLNYQAIWDFPTFLWIPEPETIYKSVKALQPGQYISYQNGNFKVKQIKNRFEINISGLDEVDLLEHTRCLVTKSIEDRLLADVPIGCFLSAGLDSSIVSTVASAKRSGLYTFSIGFDDIDDPYHGKADESEDARKYALKLGTIHKTIHVKASDFKRILEDFCHYGDQPFAVSSGLGIYTIARVARENGIKVLLSGDGADECFGGYSWYYWLNHQCKMSKPSTIGDISFQNNGIPIQQRVALLNAYSSVQRARSWHYYASESEKRRLFHPDFIHESSDRYFSLYKLSEQWSAEDFVKHDRYFYFPNEMLRKVDRMTMASSVEGRAPFAAASILGLSNQLNYNHFVKDGLLKWLLRKAFAPILPDEIVLRAKHGFNVPVDNWLKNEWNDLVQDAFSPDSFLRKSGLIHSKSGYLATAMLNDQERLNGHTIFSYIMLNMWLSKNR